MMKTSKKTLLLAGSMVLLLTGCGQANTTVTDGSEALFSVGNTTYTRNDEYQLLKRTSGPNLTLQGAQKLIYKEEVGDGEEIMKKAEEMFDQYSGYTENFEETLSSYGYKDKQEYIDAVMVPSVQAQELLNKYFSDAKETIQTTYKPTLAAIIQCDSEDNANKAKEALNNGEDPAAVGEQYAAEGATYTGKEQIVSTLDTGLPVRIVNTLFETSKEGVIDEVFTNDTSTDNKTYYVVDLISSNYDDNLEKIQEALGSNSDINQDCVVYYLKKYDFQVFDQYIFDYYKANNPEYLVTRPDLSEKEGK